MRTDQPKVVYLPSHTIEKIDYRPPKQQQPQSKLKLRKSKQIAESTPFIGDWYVLLNLVAPSAFRLTTSPLTFTANSMSASNAGNSSETNLAIKSNCSQTREGR
jgi:hypothetical protein